MHNCSMACSNAHFTHKAKADPTDHITRTGFLPNANCPHEMKYFMGERVSKKFGNEFKCWITVPGNFLMVLTRVRPV